MRAPGPAILAALDRWEEAGLISAETAATLRREAREHARTSSGRAAQYAIAATGAAVLVIAVGVLGDWLWPRLGPETRSLVLALAGLLVHGTGTQVQRRERWRAASYFLQVAGLLVLLGTYMYSEVAWADSSPGGIAVGILALITPLVAAPKSFVRRDPFLPALHLALLLGFLAVFLDRSTTLPADTIIWVLDAVLLVVAALLVRELTFARDAGEAEWALNAFVMALYAGFVLVTITALGPLDLEQRAVYGLDVWMMLTMGLTLWGSHRAPLPLQRDWLEHQLAACVLLAIPLLFFTSIELWDAPAEVTALLVGGLGAGGLWYAVRLGERNTLIASCLAVLAAAWFYGVDRGGALGVVLSLMASAAFLFWVSTRVGWERGARAGKESSGVDAGIGSL